MHRRIVGIWAMAALGLAVLPGGAIAQQKSIKDQLVGTWTLLLADEVKADGTQLPDFGPNPMGTLIFTPNGHYSLQIMRVGRPAFASNNFMSGTPAENKAAASGVISHFGTYAADDSDKSFTFRVEASSFPNWEGTRQKRSIAALTDEVLEYSFQTPANPPVRTETIWKKVK